jgi:hypothetical protein
MPETHKSNFHRHPPAAASFIRNRKRGGSFLAAYGNCGLERAIALEAITL